MPNFAAKVFDQHGNVLFSFSKSRDLNRDNIQAVKQIAPERSSADGCVQITIGGGDHSMVSMGSTSAADTFKLVVLQNTQKCNLRL
jgi:hypothetical protein